MHTVSTSKPNISQLSLTLCSPSVSVLARCYIHIISKWSALFSAAQDPPLINNVKLQLTTKPTFLFEVAKLRWIGYFQVIATLPPLLYV